MKQHITKEQWNELARGLKEKFIELTGSRSDEAMIPDSVDDLDEHIDTGNKIDITIGELIEFLGDDFKSLSYCVDEMGNYWCIYLKNDIHFCDAKEPVDICWEAVKEKLK